MSAEELNSTKNTCSSPQSGKFVRKKEASPFCSHKRGGWGEEMKAVKNMQLPVIEGTPMSCPVHRLGLREPVGEQSCKQLINLLNGFPGHLRGHPFGSLARTWGFPKITSYGLGRKMYLVSLLYLPIYNVKKKNEHLSLRMLGRC